jgi:hypothetical protein
LGAQEMMSSLEKMEMMNSSAGQGLIYAQVEKARILVEVVNHSLKQLLKMMIFAIKMLKIKEVVEGQVSLNSMN